eukprot:scaffold322546_cov38-Prasinocladus_malaysianus.AAC.1
MHGVFTVTAQNPHRQACLLQSHKDVNDRQLIDLVSLISKPARADRCHSSQTRSPRENGACRVTGLDYICSQWTRH